MTTDEQIEHCKDCCCAKSWEALGISEYTGKSIPEEIASLRAALEAREGELEEAKETIATLRAEKNRLVADNVDYLNMKGSSHKLQTDVLRLQTELLSSEKREKDTAHLLTVAKEQMTEYRRLSRKFEAENAELRERVEALGDAYTELQERVEAVKRWAQDKARSNMWPTANEITNYLAGGFGPYRPNNEESE